MRPTTLAASDRFWAAQAPSRYPGILPAGGDAAAPINLQKRLNVARRHVDVRQRRLVDCGFGGGDDVLGPLGNGADAWGIEYSPEKVARCQPAVARQLCIGDLQNIPVPIGSVDIALLNEVLEHVPDDRRAILRVFQALKPGGTVIVFSPNRRCERVPLVRTFGASQVIVARKPVR